MPRLAHDRTVELPAHQVPKWGDDGGIKREGRRQLHQEWPSFLGQTISLSQKRHQGLTRVLQLQFMGNRPRHLHSEPKIRRSTIPPLCVGGRGVRPIERRIDFSASERPCVSFEMCSRPGEPWRRRTRNRPAGSSNPMYGVFLGLDRSVTTRALHFDEAWLLHARSSDALARGGPDMLLEERDLDRPSPSRRLVQGFDDAHVLQAFVPGRFGLGVVQDAVGEVQQLRRELVASPDALRSCLPVDRQLVLQPLGILVRRISVQVSLCANDTIRRHIRCVEAGDEGSQLVVAETQRGRCRLIDLRQALSGRC